MRRNELSPGRYRPLGRKPVVRLAALALLLSTLFLSPAFAQSTLPTNAAEAIERGQALMNEALDTYDAQFPDRPLWQQAFREGRTAVQLAPGHPEPLPGRGVQPLQLARPRRAHLERVHRGRRRARRRIPRPLPAGRQR